MGSQDSDQAADTAADISVTAITAPSLADNQPSHGQSLDKMTQELSVMEIDKAIEENVSSQTSTVNIESHDTWRKLTRQAFSNRKSAFRAGATQAEQRKLLQERRKDRRLKRDLEVALSNETMPARRKGAIAACVRAGALSHDVAEKLYKDSAELPAARMSRRTQAQARKLMATSKAEQVANKKALERAIDNLSLDVTKAKSSEEQSSFPPLILSLAYAKHLIGTPSRAEKAFSALQLYQQDPSVMERLSCGQQRRLRVLQKEEESLRARACAPGSIEAALQYQDQRVAYFDELRFSRSFAKKRRSDRLNDKDATLQKDLPPRMSAIDQGLANTTSLQQYTSNRTASMVPLLGGADYYRPAPSHRNTLLPYYRDAKPAPAPTSPRYPRGRTTDSYRPARDNRNHHPLANPAHRVSKKKRQPRRLSARLAQVEIPNRLQRQLDDSMREALEMQNHLQRYLDYSMRDKALGMEENRQTILAAEENNLQKEIAEGSGRPEETYDPEEEI
ncbi:MAG: hypothetical protein LQ338_005547 [Usnochroma carphineum]|nr:MAG: hypothetical protein LQ338_005547 [Usnochroma carphineum]